jgi:hypothetical protein
MSLGALFGSPEKAPEMPKPVDAEAKAAEQRAKLLRRSGFMGSVLNRGQQTRPAGQGAGSTVG